MSHELRSLLDAILGFSPLKVGANNLSFDQHENAGIIYHSGDDLLTLINVLDLAKIEAGKTTINPTGFDLHLLLKKLENLLHLRAHNTELNLLFQRTENVTVGGEIPKTETRLIKSLKKLYRQLNFEQIVDLVEPRSGNV
ncbi:histidine kinase dimerization/phospho-acceptor domain-containing protein [Microcoleus sp. B4-D4]|uniref:histidine kinase dimerization/phospho-acceptor domain-containing protein n=1 Tax=Microcoleus sp. B4-D4 TaxID=2818667 RepID=UPI002FD07AE6